MLQIEVIERGVKEDPQQLDRRYRGCCLVLGPKRERLIVRLHPLEDEEGRHLLRNEYFEIVGFPEHNEPIRSSSRGNFFFHLDDPRFLAVQSAYSLAKAIAFCWERFQYRWRGPRLRITFSEVWEPQHDFPQGVMNLSITGGVLSLGPFHHLSFLPQALCPTTVAHEWAHFLFWDLVDQKTLRDFVINLKGRYGEGWMDSKELLESRAVQEGFCDYLAYLVFGDPDILPGMPLRNLADEAFLVHRLALLPHLRGWGQFLWQIRNLFGERADLISFLSLQFWDQATGLKGAVEALKRAAENSLGKHSAQRYQEAVEEIVQLSRLLEPPLPAELDWSIDLKQGLLQVEEEGEFLFLSKNGGLILRGRGPGRFRVSPNHPLSVYKEMADALYLGLLRDGQLLISPRTCPPPEEYPRDLKIQWKKRKHQQGGAIVFQIQWTSPYEPFAPFLLKTIRPGIDHEIPQAEPIPLGRGHSRLLWGAKYYYTSLGSKGGQLELEIPSFWLSKSHLFCIVRAQSPSGWVESQPLPLD